MSSLDLIRNFVIIAHIDHGKSTLADRMLEITKTISKEKSKPQILDTMDLERERGITIKLQPVTMTYRPSTPKQNSNFDIRISNLSSSAYTLNLIDTPGHVDFSYEVSRSLAAVEGAILLVDATQGVQAQTLANLWHAKDTGLKIIPAINKIDLFGAEVSKVEEEVADLLNIEKSEILKISAKTGDGVQEVLEKIIETVPPPKGQESEPLKALIFDSIYDSYRGVIAYVRVVEGKLRKKEKIKFLATGKIEEALEVGKLRLGYEAKEELKAGEIGYIVTGAKDISEIKVGDTIAALSPASVSPISGFKIPQSMVFASFYNASGELGNLRSAILKLKLNDSSLTFEPENSAAFGQGFRCGFLGLLHLEIIKERLEREYNLDLIVTSPSVKYEIQDRGGRLFYKEPWAKLEIVTPNQYLGAIMELLQSKRGVYLDTKYLGDRVLLYYEAPLSELIIDFYDKLKSISSGYASQNYELIGWREGDLEKLKVIIAGDEIEEFSRVVPRVRAQSEAKNLALKLKELIPRQMFEVSVQVAAGGKILARENISAMKKDVTAKLYGGDVTRKNKLLKKQAKGKKRMKTMGKVQIPDSVFIDLLRS